jgi:hypothetical protein
LLISRWVPHGTVVFWLWSCPFASCCRQWWPMSPILSLLSNGKQIIDTLWKFHGCIVINFRNGSFLFHKLSFSIQTLGHAVSHGNIIIFKDGIDRKGPRIPSLNAKDILEREWFFVGLTHRVGCLFLQSINSTNPRHESIADIHEHAGCEQKGANA